MYHIKIYALSMMQLFLITQLVIVLQDMQFWGHTVPVVILYDEHIQTMTIAVVILDLKGDNDGRIQNSF